MKDPKAEAARAQARASDPGISAWVSANAGSGKTHVLVNRVIRLLLSGCEPERILCLTFTRAAAAEMARRLFEVLSGWIALDDERLIDAIHMLSGHVKFGGDLKIARRLFARALETPGGLKIQTIHAFCERLLQRFPVEAGVAPGFRVLEEQEAAALLAEARGEVVAAASRAGEEGAMALARVVAYAGEDALDGLLRELLGRRAELRRLLGGDEAWDAALDGLCRVLGVAPDETLETALADVCAWLDMRALGAAADMLGLRSATTDRETGGQLGAALRAEDRGARLEHLKKAFLKADGKRKSNRSILTASAARDHPDIAEALCAQADRVAAHADLERSLAIRDATIALLEIADRIIGSYEAKKLRLGRYDYDDLIARTLSMFSELESAAWVLYRLDGGLDHILVDEAQDTSRAQWRIIAELASEFFAGEGQRAGIERTVFAVGDRKQSIFSFQGADPDAFDDMQKHFRERIRGAGKTFETVPLDVSFRSTQDILDAVDAVFAAGAARDGVIAADAPDLVHSAVRVNEPGLIEIWEPIPRAPRAASTPWDLGDRVDPGRSPRAQLAARVAGLIRRWLDEGERLAATGKPIRPGDILILLKQRTTFMDALVKALKQHAIPVAGADRLKLNEHIAVQDLLSLIRFILLPEDDLALAEVLKSPLVRRDDGGWIDDDDLVRIGAERGLASLWSALRRKAREGAPYVEAVERIGRWAGRADFEPPYEFLAGVLGEDGGRKAFLQRLGQEAIEPIEALLTLALDFAQGEAASLRAFIAHVEAEGGEIKRDTDQLADEVRVMTVHGAKGLEAPIVFLPDTCDAPDGRSDSAILMAPGEAEGALDVPVWRLKSDFESSRVEALKARHRERAHEEYRRLLYVAMTRARDRLYVCGALGTNAPPEECWHRLVADALKPKARKLLAEDGAVAGWRIERGAGAGAKLPEDMVAVSDIPPPPAWAVAPAPPEPITDHWLVPSRIPEPGQGEASSSPIDQSGPRRFLRGRLIHRLLQMLPDLPPPLRRTAADRYLARAAGELAAADRGGLLEEAMAIIESPALSALFGPGSLAEVPIAAILPDGRRLTGQLDRIAMGEKEVMVADYKTNRPPPERLEDVDPAYVRQLAAYRRALVTMHPGRVVRCILLWTDGPKVMEVPAAILDAVALHA